MAWRIGLDEAGYGPNLGPLVVAATAWRSDSSADLYEALGAAVTDEPDGQRIAIADSKRLYKPGGGLRLLELGVGAALGGLDNWPSLLEALAADPDDRRNALPWTSGLWPELPLDATPDELATAARRLQEACATHRVTAPIVRARMVHPEQFNALVEQFGTKGAALSHVTIGLLREVVDGIGDDDRRGGVRCTLDKHGGRNRYAALLQHHFPEHWIETLAESRASSRYAWGGDEGRVEAEFRTGGEAELPTALASMTAKLLRELAMREFNEFWLGHIPDLKPTAGYPVDAKRFKAQIAEKQAELAIEDNILWRCR